MNVAVEYHKELNVFFSVFRDMIPLAFYESIFFYLIQIVTYSLVLHEVFLQSQQDDDVVLELLWCNVGEILE